MNYAKKEVMRSFKIWNDNIDQFTDDDDPKFLEMRDKDQVYKAARNAMFSISKKVVTIQGINFLLLLLMVIFMARLVFRQKQLSLVPATFCALLYSIAFVVDEFS